MEIAIRGVQSIQLFGSYARNEESNLSDYDILVILEKGIRVSENLEKEIKTLFNRNVSISWYSKERIIFLFETGHLFAWHLYLESKPISNDYFISTLGVPSIYSRGLADVKTLLQILKSVKTEVIKTPKNIVYEAGLAYVCARNIAISTLPILKREHNFGVTAPFKLNFTLTNLEYNLLANCRYSGTRGFQPPKIDLDEFIILHEKIDSWGLQQFKNLKSIYGNK